MDKELTKDILQWDTVNWSVPLEYWESALPSKGESIKCLELGCREGGLSLWLALKGFDVVASDLKDTRKTALPLHEKYHVEEKITYEDINALSIPYENYFDVIVFKSILGGIGYNNRKDNQDMVFSQIHKALKPGGKLLFAENSRATMLHEFFRRKFTSWGESWRYISYNEMKQFLKSFSGYELRSTGFAGVFGRNENQKRFLGKMDRMLISKMSPPDWKYIIYGMAVK